MRSSRLIIHKIGALLSVFIVSGFIDPGLFSQKILPDTIHVTFRADTLIELTDICITKIIDKRDEDPRFVRYNSKNKYLILPVDEEVYTIEPLADEIKKGDLCNTADRQLQIEIEKFYIEEQKGRFYSSLILVADLPVYEKINDSLIYQGTFFYDYEYFPQTKKEPLGQSTENIMAKWHTEFKLDMLSLKMDSLSRSVREYSNFITNQFARSLYLNTSVASFAGYNWWGIQAEISFLRPETNSRNRYLAGIFRYQNTPDYESFAIGKQSEHYTYRRSPNWLFDLDFNFLIGFCKWKDIEKYQPTLYQLFNMELSSVQSIIYSPINRRGITLRLGTIESLNYVIERNPKFYAGIFVGFGVKL
jgi:hypothetical protein